MDLSNLKGIVSGLVNNVSQKGRDLAENAADKAKSAGRIAKLKLELSGEKDSLKRTFGTIGETYYENRGEASDALLAQLCEEADTTKERISAIEAELEQLKDEFAPRNDEADVEVSFEELVDEAEQEAAPVEKSACPEDDCITVDEVIDKVDEVIDDIKDKVEDIIEDITEDITDKLDGEE